MNARFCDHETKNFPDLTPAVSYFFRIVERQDKRIDELTAMLEQMVKSFESVVEMYLRKVSQ